MRRCLNPVRNGTESRPSSMALAIMPQGNLQAEGLLNEPPLRQRLATILVADVAGYSRLMGCDECGTVAACRLPQQPRDRRQRAVVWQGRLHGRVGGVHVRERSGGRTARPAIHRVGRPNRCPVSALGLVLRGKNVSTERMPWPPGVLTRSPSPATLRTATRGSRAHDPARGARVACVVGAVRAG